MAPLLLRECAVELSHPLSMIYSRSLLEHNYPDRWKLSNLTPVFKSGKKTDVTNYRGVCLTPNWAKAFEIVIVEQLKYNIYPHLSSTQHGFFPGRRVESNLMELSILVHESFDNGKQTDVFLADIHKAFDAIRSLRLVKKTSANKCKLCNSTLLWFCSFLSYRKQKVKINSCLSDLIDVLSGIGQGSVVAALLFVLYFDDSDCSPGPTRAINFADDKKIVHNDISTIDDTHVMQKSIDDFVKW